MCVKYHFGTEIQKSGQNAAFANTFLKTARRILLKAGEGQPFLKCLSQPNTKLSLNIKVAIRLARGSSDVWEYQKKEDYPNASFENALPVTWVF